MPDRLVKVLDITPFAGASVEPEGASVPPGVLRPQPGRLIAGKSADQQCPTSAEEARPPPHARCGTQARPDLPAALDVPSGNAGNDAERGHRFTRHGMTPFSRRKLAVNIVLKHVTPIR